MDISCPIKCPKSLWICANMIHLFSDKPTGYMVASDRLLRLPHSAYRGIRAQASRTLVAHCTWRTR
jgi:hypothetical protein